MFANYPAMMEQDTLVNHVIGQMASSHLHSRRQSNNSASRASSQCRRSIRIEKPRSTHSSPRRMERRKTTSTIRQLAVTDEQLAAWANESYHHPVGDSWQQPKHSSRPMSWHPSSTQVYTPPVALLPPQSTYASPSFHNANQRIISPAQQMISMEYQNFTAMPAYSQPQQPTSYPAFAETQQSIQSFQTTYPQVMATLEAATASVPATSTAPTMSYPVFQNEQHQQPISAFQQGFDPTSQPRAQAQEHQHQQTAYPTSAPTASIQDIPVHIPTNDFSPENNNIAVMEAELSPDAEGEDDGEELVGMGLYDLPDTTSWLLTGQSTGKGLKLEEAWQPPPERDDDEDAEDEDEDEDDEEELEAEPEPEAEADVSSAEESDGEPPVSMATGWPLQSQIPHHPYHSQQQEVVSSDLSGQSFFFEEDTVTATKPWWYEPQKQHLPVMAQQAALGYGWIYSS